MRVYDAGRCDVCRGLGCYACLVMDIDVRNLSNQTCPCSMTWASPTPRPICPTHGKPAESVFQPPIYFGSDREWKRQQFPTTEVM